MEKIIRCPQCSRPYRVYAHYCGDQSLCPGCRMELEAEVQRWEQSGYGSLPIPRRYPAPKPEEGRFSLQV